MSNNLIPNKKKYSFKELKNNATCSLFEVEKFLCSLKKTCSYYNLYKLIKK